MNWLNSIDIFLFRLINDNGFIEMDKRMLFVSDKLPWIPLYILLLYLLFRKYDGFWKDEYEKLKIRCDEVGIEFISTPFDLESAKFLNDLMSVFKVSSSDITNKPFIEKICEFFECIFFWLSTIFIS